MDTVKGNVTEGTALGNCEKQKLSEIFCVCVCVEGLLEARYGYPEEKPSRRFSMTTPQINT